MRRGTDGVQTPQTVVRIVWIVWRPGGVNPVIGRRGEDGRISLQGLQQFLRGLFPASQKNDVLSRDLGYGGGGTHRLRPGGSRHFCRRSGKGLAECGGAHRFGRNRGLQEDEDFSLRVVIIPSLMLRGARHRGQSQKDNQGDDSSDSPHYFHLLSFLGSECSLVRDSKGEILPFRGCSSLRFAWVLRERDRIRPG